MEKQGKKKIKEKRKAKQAKNIFACDEATQKQDTQRGREREREQKREVTESKIERGKERESERERAFSSEGKQRENQNLNCNLINSSCYLFFFVHTHVTRLVFIYARFHNWALFAVETAASAAAASSNISSIEFRFSFTHVFQFPFVVSLYTHTVQHNTRYNQHTTFLYFISIASSLYMCVCVYSLPGYVCVPIFHYGYFALLYVTFFFILLPSLCTRIHTHSLTYTHSYTHEQHAGTQRNAAPQRFCFIRDNTGRITAHGNR